ncbi:MAG: hypothetical protein LBH86_01600 [Oscillospiraceae bacterium]|nr:hypothetical protein [Oscillospiraceae bacterium]
MVVRVINMPTGIKGVTSPSEDGAFNVYINARWPYETQRDALQHELNHIRRDDFHAESLEVAEG